MPAKGSPIWVVISAGLLVICGLTPGSLPGRQVDCDNLATAGAAIDKHLCGCCERPKTLFEWSVGGPEEEKDDSGEDEPLATDRPDFTETSSTVGLGRLQIEMGWTYSENDDAGVRTRCDSYPETLLRVGMFAEWFEARVAYNYVNETTQVGSVRSTVRGSEDLYLGVKLALTEQKGVWPEMALTPQMTVPTGSSAITDDEVLPGVNWLYGWDVTDWLSTAGSTQVNRAIDEVSRDVYCEFAQSWTFGLSFTERLGAYTEWYALIPSSAETNHTEHYFNGGFTYKVTNDWQLDVRGGVGLNDAADDWFFGPGMGLRF
jgi:hypothetical protein